jgi:hypothetical protein
MYIYMHVYVHPSGSAASSFAHSPQAPRDSPSAERTTARGEPEAFDRVIFACDLAAALALLDERAKSKAPPRRSRRSACLCGEGRGLSCD